MIDDKTMNTILPINSFEDEMDLIKSELSSKEFVVTNFTSGGVFYTIVAILIQIKLELITLLRKVVNNSFITHAEDEWIELNAADYSKKRKQPTKAKGYVTIARAETGEAITISKYDVFKTTPDSFGRDLKYIVLEDTILQQDLLSVQVLVEAEKEGTDYNVSENMITRSLTHIEGIDTITNDSNWLVSEGSDLETLESLRSRCLNAWSELSTYAIRDKYKSVCEAVEGVLYITVDDMHPRGQATVDIIVTSTAGAATETLIEKVYEAANQIKGPDDDILVKSSETVEQDFEIVIYIPSSASDNGVIDVAEDAIIRLMQFDKNRELNKLYRDDIVYYLKDAIDVYKKADIISPATDVILTNDKVLILGSIAVTVERI